MRDFLKFIWCWIFHKEHHKRVGEIDYYKVLAFYDVRCEKCGNIDTVMFRWNGPKY